MSLLNNCGIHFIAQYTVCVIIAGRRQEGSTASKKTPSTDPFLTASRKVRKPRRKIAKADIGMPSDFKPLGHVGFDPTTGEFDVCPTDLTIIYTGQR